MSESESFVPRGNVKFGTYTRKGDRYTHKYIDSKERNIDKDQYDLAKSYHDSGPKFKSKKSNVKKSNVKKSNVKKSNVKKSNVKKSNAKKSNAKKSNAKKSKKSY